MTATYTFDIFCTPRRLRLPLQWWRLGRLLGQAGPRAARAPSRAVRRGSSGWSSGPPRIGQFVEMLASSDEEPEVLDPWVTRMRHLPATVVSST